MLSTGGFSIKAWLTSSNVQDELRNTNPNLSPDLLSPEESKILGMFWDRWVRPGRSSGHLLSLFLVYLDVEFVLEIRIVLRSQASS